MSTSNGLSPALAQNVWSNSDLAALPENVNESQFTIMRMIKSFYDTVMKNMSNLIITWLVEINYFHEAAQVANYRILLYPDFTFQDYESGGF